MKTEKIIYIILIISLLLAIFSFAQISGEPIKEKMPGILAGWWNSIKTFFGKTKDVFWSAFIKAWQGAVALWHKMWIWIKNTWETYISSKFDLLSEKIRAKFR
jgi:hypothetical protein